MSRHAAALPRHICTIGSLLRLVLAPRTVERHQGGAAAESQRWCSRRDPRLFVRQLANSGDKRDVAASDGPRKFKEKVIILTGATAAGKTKASIELAQRLGGEIISADSVQVYKGLDVGSDKVCYAAFHLLHNILEHALHVLNIHAACRSCHTREGASLTTLSTFCRPTRSSRLGTSMSWLAQPLQTSCRHAPCSLCPMPFLQAGILAYNGPSSSCPDCEECCKL